MNWEERTYLKKKIELDLECLISQCWSTDTIEPLEKVLQELQQINMEAYDD